MPSTAGPGNPVSGLSRLAAGYLATSGSTPMPTMTVVRSRGNSIPAAASRAASSRSTCCACANSRSRGGKRKPGSLTSMDERGPGCRSPSRIARRKSSASSPSPTLAPIAVMATAASGRRVRRAAGISAPGTHSSTMRCAFVPPKPKALTAHRRGPGHSSSPASRRSGVPSNAVIGSSALSEGGRTWARMAPSTLSSPAPPAAVSRCPILDFTEPTGRSSQSANTRAMLLASTVSPTGVPVA